MSQGQNYERFKRCHSYITLSTDQSCSVNPSVCLFQASLANLCGVSGIPMLVVFKIEGNKAKLVDKNGRGHVSSKPNLDFDCLK